MLRRTLPLAVCLVAASVTGCVTPQDIEGLNTQLADIQRQVLQIQKQAPSKEEVSSQMTTLGSNMGRQMESLLKTEADMQVKLQDLSSQIDELQAKLEDTNYRLAQLSQQIAATNQELKTFQSQPSLPPAAGPQGTIGGDPQQPAQPGGNTPPPQQNPGAGSGANPQTLYNSAYNDYLKGSYDLALREFQEYLDNFPTTDLADNATYWTGECYYRQRRFRQAVDQFDAVLERYPRSDKVAAATLKKGYALLELGERSQGVVQLRHVIRQYPTSDEANLARQRLREIGVDAS
ncbi:MAG TPA: tol-pal system protein YbgF [Thermoanaerobaculia bacterium]|jgi:tol-pal system protein YbgF|nr:tol-pal system protein YbgF [Thermoanaerobaculia bacterium]